MKKLLVTGASGFLGWNVCQLPLTDWVVIGAWHESKSGIFPKTPHYQIDLTDRDANWRMLREINPDAVFHLAAISGTGTCESEPKKSFPINVEAAVNLAEMCAERKVKYFFTSSEQVFDGESGNYSEDNRATPKNEYGRQKSDAEKAILSMGIEAAVVRLAVMFGKGGPTSNSFLEQWLDSWLKFIPVTTFHDEIRSFLSGKNAAQGLFHLLEQEASGLFHLGGKDALSRTEFAEMAISIFGLPQARIKSVSQKDVELSAYRPPNLSLDISKLEGTGFSPNSLAVELENLKGNLDLRTMIGLN